MGDGVGALPAPALIGGWTRAAGRPGQALEQTVNTQAARGTTDGWTLATGTLYSAATDRSQS